MIIPQNLNLKEQYINNFLNYNNSHQANFVLMLNKFKMKFQLSKIMKMHTKAMNMNIATFRI